MNENLNLVKILKDCPKGTPLYSTIHGNVNFIGIDDKEITYPIEIEVSDKDGCLETENYTSHGRFFHNYNGECALFPSEEQRDWSKFKVKKPKFDPIIMTQKEIENFLSNTKVYVAGKSKEIQEKLFSFGFSWLANVKVSHTKEPFLYLDEDKKITWGNDMQRFTTNEYREITAEQILSLEVTEPSCRPFKDKEECWQEMLKHQPLGWLISKESRNYIYVSKVSTSITSNYALIVLKDTELYSDSVFNNYTFLDGTPFGIKEE